MRVSELLEQLKDLPPDRDVVIATEGNSFQPLSQVDAAAAYDGCDLVHEDDVGDYGEGEIETVVCLWP
jgi:hypothetical protein